VTTYLVTAYRWGNSNDHQYQVYAGPDRTKAEALAVEERAGRVGKYDCAVYEFNEDGTEYKQVAWFPSYDKDSSGAKINWRIEMFEKLGHFVDRYADGSCLLPDPDKQGFLTFAEVTPDPLVVAEVKRVREIHQRLEELSAKRTADTSSGAP
jgi:hypothetical protein